LLIDEVEALWAPIAANDDWTAFTKKIEIIQSLGLGYGAKIVAD
jgi:hypothetical protein